MIEATPRCPTGFVLSKFGPQDFADYCRLVGNAEVMAMITERAIPEHEARRDYAQLLKENTLHPQLGHWRIVDVDSGHFIGLAKLQVVAADSAEAELGYMLLPAYWARGLGSAIAAELLARSENVSGLRQLTAIIDPANTASRRILLKLGFAHHQYRDFDGLPGEILTYALPRSPLHR